MPYVLTKSNGRIFATIQDGSIDKSTALTFIGKNYAGYGQILQQDLLYILENFSNSTAPQNPLQGQLWFDSANLKLNVYDGTAFKGLSFTTLSNSQPSTAQDGDFWFNTSNNQLSIKVGDTFTKISGSGGTSGSGAVLATIKDTDDNSHTILKTSINNNDISIFSYEDIFVNSAESIYSLFPILKRGLNLAGADVIGRTASTVDGILVWGTAATSLKSDTLYTLANGTTNYYYATTSTTANTVVARGNTGEIWASNFVNSVGPIGQGYTGSIGFVGSRGAGFTGSASTAIGYTGSAGGGGGGSGYTGSRGYWGSVGYYGSRGILGYTGSAGAGGVGSGTLYNVTPGYTSGGQVFVTATQPAVSLVAGDVWFDTSLNGSLTSNGWTQLPNGLKMAWGLTAALSLTGTTTNFPSGVNFTSVFSVSLTTVNTGAGNIDGWSQLISFGTTSFNAMTQLSAGSTPLPAYYIAIGI